MLKKFIGAIVSALLCSSISARDTKIGIISDIHLKLMYNPLSSKNYCTVSTESDADKFLSKDEELRKDQIALLGRLGCDAPQLLLEYILQLFDKVNRDEPVDFIILNGDLVAHKVAQDTTNDDANLYQLLRDTHQEVQKMFTKYLPYTPVFLTLGNNDCKYHDNAPFPEDKEDYYDFLFQLWYNQHPGNRNYASIVESTFKDGGYYKIDVNDQFSVLAFNTLPYNKDQVVEKIGPEAENQFQWLEDNLKDSSGRKYIIFTHIYAGGRIKHDDTQKPSNLWNPDYNKRYFDLMLKYKDRIIIELAGHDHWEDFRMNIDADGNMYHNMFVATGVGLDHKQLPGFNSMMIDEQTLIPKDVKETILDITAAYGYEVAPPLDSLPVHTVDFAEDFGFGEYSAEAINFRIQEFEKYDLENILQYLSEKIGYEHSDDDKYAQGLKLAASWSLIDKSHTNADAFLCQSQRNISKDDIKDCLENRRMQRIKQAQSQSEQQAAEQLQIIH